jgi:hypothetical protein
MVVAPSSGFVELPGVDRENQREDGEEGAGDLEGEDAGGVGEGTPHGCAEASCSAGEATAAFGHRRRGRSGRLDRFGRGGGGGSGLRGVGSLHSRDGPGGSVAQFLGGDARANAQSSAEAIRLHGKSLAAPGKRQHDSDCPAGTSDDKVRESAAAGKRGPDLNQKLRKLVQQLGEAIHESVSESPRIAGVVADIRRQGFEVMLMLEATIGLNEVEEQPDGALDASKTAQERADAEEQGTFTAQDLHFLKSLRISIAGEQGEQGEEGPGEQEDV